MKPLRDTDLMPGYYAGLRNRDLIPPQCRDDETRWPWLQDGWLPAIIIASIIATGLFAVAVNHITTPDLSGIAEYAGERP